MGQKKRVIYFVRCLASQKFLFGDLPMLPLFVLAHDFCQVQEADSI